MLVAVAALHTWVFACHGEQSFDAAIAVQFVHLAWNGWGASGLVGGTAFADHFNPLFLLPAPLYLVWPGHVALQVVKAAALLSMLPAIALLAKPRLGRRGAQLAVALVLLSPMFWVSVLADYHAETLAAGLIPWMLLAYERERLGPCLVLAALVALGKENLPLVVGGLGVLALCDGRPRRWWLSLGGLGAVIFVLGVLVVVPASGPEGAGHQVLYAHLKTAGGWGKVLGNPTLYTWLGFLLLSCGGLCLLAPRALWPLVPLLLQHGLSLRDSERSVEFHYLAPILPLLTYAAILGASELRARAATWPEGRRAHGARSLSLALPLVTFLLLVTVGPAARVRGMQRQHGAARLAAAIPPGAPAWASLSTSCRLARRDRVYMVESVTTGAYPSRPQWTFDLEQVRPLPQHGLIDARDPLATLPPGLVPVEAVGDLLLLAAGRRSPLLRQLPTDAAYRGTWATPGPRTPLPLRVQAGQAGRYRVALDRPLRPPLVELRLIDADRRVLDQRAHRLLYGLVARSGVWETTYRPPALEARPELRTGPPLRLYVRMPGRAEWTLLTTY